MLSANICQISTAYWLYSAAFVMDIFGCENQFVNFLAAIAFQLIDSTVCPEFGIGHNFRADCWEKHSLGVPTTKRIIYGNPSELFWWAPLFESAFHPHPYPCSSINLTLFHHSVNSFSRHSARRKIYLWKLNLSCDASFFLYFHFDLFHANERNHFEPKNIFGL